MPGIEDRNSYGLEIGMLKLRKGIKFPIIPEDFLHSEQESKRMARKPPFTPAGRILSHNSTSEKICLKPGKRKY